MSSTTAIHHGRRRSTAGEWTLLGLSQAQMAVVGLSLIVLSGAFLRVYKPGAYSIGNAYYAATVKSMLTS